MIGNASISRRSFVLTGALTSLGLAACNGSDATTTGSTTERATASVSSDALGENPADMSAVTLDPSAWNYDADNDIWYQIGVQYCATPAATDYETMGVYVPGAYLNGTENGDGTYTCEVNESGAQGGFTAATAPVVIPVNTAGYSAQEAPSSYSANGLTDYLSEGLIYVYPGCRGRNNGENADGTSYAGGAPWGVTDLKAAIRCLRYNAAKLPGDLSQVFTFGHSGGGAQSSLVGATGDSVLYAPYLSSIGAVFTDDDGNAISDAVAGSMCWCPITSLDVADEAYEWMMGQFASSGTRADGTWTKLLSDDLAASFAVYVNDMGFVDADGNALELSEGGEGIYTSGSYYDAVLATVETSLNDFLADTEFPYTPGSTTMADGGFAGGGEGGGPSGAMPSGEMPSGNAPSDLGGEDSNGGPSDEMPSGGGMPGGSSDASSESSSTTYETAEDYIASLNADTEWITYDSAANTATVESVGAFVAHCKAASKDVGAFDALDRSQAENYVFGNAESDALHFDATMARLLADEGDAYAACSDYDASYAEEYAADMGNVDDLGTTTDVRQDMYNPLYYVAQNGAGFGTSTPAAHWRIRTGIEQGDTSLTTELDLAWSLAANAAVSDVDFATVWGQGHTTAERTGSSTENFIAWVKDCC